MVTDFHTHAFPDDLAAHALETLNAGVPAGAEAVLDGTLDDLLRSMDRAGIERSVICSVATAPRQVRPILEWSLEVRCERIVPFGSVHPECEDPAAEVRRIAEAGLRGAKLHALYQDFTVDRPGMWPVYGALEEEGLVLVLHAGQDVAFPAGDDRAAPRRIRAVHDAFPELPLVAAHMGGWRMWQQVAETLAGADVYLETSYTFCEGQQEAVDRILERHSPRRILFGTDSPWRDQARTLADVRRVFSRPRERRLVLEENAESLLARTG